jgi:hypothetical protein
MPGRADDSSAGSARLPRPSIDRETCASFAPAARCGLGDVARPFDVDLQVLLKLRPADVDVPRGVDHNIDPAQAASTAAASRVAAGPLDRQALQRPRIAGRSDQHADLFARGQSLRTMLFPTDP